MYSKKILFIAIFALAFIFFACSDDPNSPPTPPPDCDPAVSICEEPPPCSDGSCELSSSSDPVEISSSSDEPGCDPLLTDCQPQSSSSFGIQGTSSSSSLAVEESSSSGEITQSSSSSENPVSSSSTQVAVTCDNVSALFCGGASVTNTTSAGIPSAGACLFIRDFEQIEGDLAGQGSNIKINGNNFPCVDNGNGEADWTACKVNTAKGNKPAPVHGGYYVYVESGNINTFQNNGWLNVVPGLSDCLPPSLSSSSEVVPTSSSSGGGSDKENFHIYLAFGQSNMEGTSNSAIPNSYKTVDDRFQVMAAVSGNYGGIQRTKGQWYTAIPPLVRPSTYLSPADYFGRTIVANTPNNIKVGVIVVAVGGAAIDGFMKTGAPNYYRNEASWMQDWARNYNNDPYNHLIELAKEAQKVGTIKGILMHQGESGAKNGNWAQNVNTIYNNMLSDLGLAANSIPFIAGEPMNVNKHLVTNLPNTFTATMPNGKKVCHIAKSEGLVIFDQYHFTYESYETLGKRYGEIMLDLLYR